VVERESPLITSPGRDPDRVQIPRRQPAYSGSSLGVTGDSSSRGIRTRRPGDRGGEARASLSDTVVVKFTAASKEGHTVPKAIKGNASRKPPEPAKNHSDIDDWFGRQMPHLQPIVKKLDETIRATIPGLHYAVKWKRPYYGLPELGWIIELAAYDVSVNVVFLGGADFDRPPPMGTTGRTRYVKVTTVEEVQRPELRQWIEDAGGTPGWK
jgi:hypothetical protein